MTAPDDTPRLKPRAPQYVIDHLRKARAQLLKGPDTVEGRGWAAGASYLDSWVVPELDRAIAWAEGHPVKRSWEGYTCIPAGCSSDCVRRLEIP